MAPHRAMSAEDKAFQAENDVSTLAESEVIKSDRPRMKAASKTAKSIAKEAKVKADAIAKVARTNVTKKKTSKKKTTRRT